MSDEEKMMIKERNKGDQDFITKEAKRILEEKKNGTDHSNKPQAGSDRRKK